MITSMDVSASNVESGVCGDMGVIQLDYQHLSGVLKALRNEAFCDCVPGYKMGRIMLRTSSSTSQ